MPVDLLESLTDPLDFSTIPVHTYTVLAGDWNNVFNPMPDRHHSTNNYTSRNPEHRLLARLTSPHRRIPLIDIDSD
jgi:hypothetical protein